MKVFTWVIYPILLSVVAIVVYTQFALRGVTTSDAAGLASIAMLAMLAVVIMVVAAAEEYYPEFDMEQYALIGSSFTAMFAAAFVSSYGTIVPLASILGILGVVCFLGLAVVFWQASGAVEALSVTGPSVVIVVTGIMDRSGARVDAGTFLIAALVFFLFIRAIRPILD